MTNKNGDLAFIFPNVVWAWRLELEHQQKPCCKYKEYSGFINFSFL